MSREGSRECWNKFRAEKFSPWWDWNEARAEPPLWPLQERTFQMAGADPPVTATGEWRGVMARPVRESSYSWTIEVSNSKILSNILKR